MLNPPLHLHSCHSCRTRTISHLKDCRSQLPVLPFSSSFSRGSTMIFCRLRTETATPLQKALRMKSPCTLNQIVLFSGAQKALRGLGPARPLTSRGIMHTSAPALTPSGMICLPFFRSLLCREDIPDHPIQYSLLSHYYISFLFSSKALTFSEVFLFAFLHIFCAFPQRQDSFVFSTVMS